jgi:hypothetical protein
MVVDRGDAMEDPNVYREVITRVRDQIQRIHPSAGGDLLEAARLAHRPDVWGGAFAERWTADLDNRLRHLANQVIDIDLAGVVRRLEIELAKLEEATRAAAVAAASPPAPPPSRSGGPGARPVL